MKLIKHPLALLLVFFLSAGLVIGQDGEEPDFTQAELEQILAPIALYPDVLLSQVLMAATYPLEVVDASRWSRAHPELDGDAAVQAVQDRTWDTSVKALVGFPDLIQRMDENLDWTRRLGDAFLMQEAQVMETTQQLRDRALAEGSLDDVEHITVVREQEQIIIEPTDVRVVYVPYYSTRIVYGDWRYHDYPPTYWGPPSGSYGSVGFWWGTGFRVSTDFYYSSCDWPTRNIIVVNPYRGRDRFDFHRNQVLRRHDHYSRVWRHDPHHRRNVRYRDPSLYDRYWHQRRNSDYWDRDRIHRSDRERRQDRVDRDRHDGRIDRNVRDRRQEIVDRRPEIVDRRERVERYNAENRREMRQRQERIKREHRQDITRERRDEKKRPAVVNRPAPNREKKIARPPVRKEVKRQDPKPPPSYQANSKYSRIRKNSDGQSRSIDRRAAWRKRDR